MQSTKLFLLLILPLLALSGAAEAAPRRSADMFEDTNVSTYQRPRVPSDANYGQDMFKGVPVLYNRDADLFDGMRSGFQYLDADMMHVHPQPYVGGPLFAQQQ